jgi:hypothetical protein
MTLEIRLPRSLYNQAVDDLRRPHPFAWERVGFLFGRSGNAGDGFDLVLLTRYRSIPDDHYLEDESVGARIGQAALTQAMRDLYHGRNQKEGLFHVHLHDDKGETGMSRTDARELPAMIPGFQAVAKGSTHGILILSADHGTAWGWLPGTKEGVVAARVVIAGAPLSIFEGGRAW